MWLIDGDSARTEKQALSPWYCVSQNLPGTRRTSEKRDGAWGPGHGAGHLSMAKYT